MKTLTKRELALMLSADAALASKTRIRIRRSDAAEIVQFILDTLGKHLLDGGSAEFRDFGVFEVVTRKARVGRNPRSPDETYDVPARRVVHFKPGKLLKASLAPQAKAKLRKNEKAKRASPPSRKKAKG